MRVLNTGNTIFKTSAGQLSVEALGGGSVKLNSNGSMGMNVAAGYSYEIDVGGSEVMRIDSSGDVNIGTTGAATGSHKLVVESASTTGTVNSHIALIGDSATNGQGPQILFSESGDGQSYAGGTIGFTRTGGNSQGALLFGTRGSSGDATTTTTERMRIESDGAIGFGTNDPFSYGGQNFEFKDTSTAQTGVRVTSSASSFEIGTDANGGYLQAITPGDGIRFYTANSSAADTTAMAFSSTGKVGIGTSSPAEMLHIVGGGNGPEIRMQNSTSSHYIRAYNDNWNFLANSTNTAMTIRNSGQVDFGAGLGIGGTGTANTLDDYEEGTWTPTISAGTVGASSGTYTKVGRVVTVTYYILLSTLGGSTSPLQIGGLPFTSGVSGVTGSHSAGSILCRFFTKNQIVSYVPAGVTYIHFYNNSSSNWDQVTYGEVEATYDNDFEAHGTLQYIV